MRPEERSDVWGVCHELAVAVHQATRGWPAAELYGLAGQARRAVVAAALNVADDPPDADPVRRRRRMGQALRALRFLGYIFVLARELDYLTLEGWQDLDRVRHRAEVLMGESG